MKKAGVRDQDALAAFKKALHGSTANWRDNLSSNPLKIYGNEKCNGSFVVHQSGPLKNTYDRAALAAWLKVDDDKAAADRIEKPLRGEIRDLCF